MKSLVIPAAATLLNLGLAASSLAHHYKRILMHTPITLITCLIFSHINTTSCDQAPNPVETKKRFENGGRNGHLGEDLGVVTTFFLIGLGLHLVHYNKTHPFEIWEIYLKLIFMPNSGGEIALLTTASPGVPSLAMEIAKKLGIPNPYELSGPPFVMLDCHRVV